MVASQARHWQFRTASVAARMPAVPQAAERSIWLSIERLTTLRDAKLLHMGYYGSCATTSISSSSPGIASSGVPTAVDAGYGLTK